MLLDIHLCSQSFPSIQTSLITCFQIMLVKVLALYEIECGKNIFLLKNYCGACLFLYSIGMPYITSFHRVLLWEYSIAFVFVFLVLDTKVTYTLVLFYNESLSIESYFCHKPVRLCVFYIKGKLGFKRFSLVGLSD